MEFFNMGKVLLETNQIRYNIEKVLSKIIL